jgi:hypothetical protein
MVVRLVHLSQDLKCLKSAVLSIDSKNEALGTEEGLGEIKLVWR